MRKWFLLIAALGLVLALAACGSEKDEPTAEPKEDNEPLEENDENTGDPLESNDEVANVTVDLISTTGDSVGTAELTEEDNGVRD